MVCGTECCKVDPVVGWSRGGVSDLEIHSWLGACEGHLAAAGRAVRGSGTALGSVKVTRWISEEVGRIKVALVPDCGTSYGVQRVAVAAIIKGTVSGGAEVPVVWRRRRHASRTYHRLGTRVLGILPCRVDPMGDLGGVWGRGSMGPA